jgi:hypothetical protein
MKKASDANLDFDGMTGNGVNRAPNRFAGNHWGGVNKEKLVNEGRGPTKGNQCYHGVGGPSVTKDERRYPPATSEASGREYPKNPDSLNYGKQFREYSTKTVTKPSRIDNINIEAKGTQGMGKTERGSRPVAAGKTDGINYGPKKQY